MFHLVLTFATYKDEESFPHHVLEDSQQWILGRKKVNMVGVWLCSCTLHRCVRRVLCVSV